MTKITKKRVLVCQIRSIAIFRKLLPPKKDGKVFCKTIFANMDSGKIPNVAYILFFIGWAEGF